MKIVNIEIYEVVLPMVKQFKTGFGNITDSPEVIVVLKTADGLIGYGESATLRQPVYNHETTASCISTIKDYIAPRILNNNYETVEDFVGAYSDIVGNQIAKAGVECAFWHLVSQRDNVSLKTLFGGKQTEITVGEGIGIKTSVDDVLEDAKKYLKAGFVRLKIKIEPGWDIEPLAAIRKKYPDIELVADGNSAYRFPEHKKLLVSLEQFNLSMLEQPLPVDDFVDHAALQAATTTPICLDESIESLNDARTAIALKSCQAINIKPGRVGGILEAIAIHDETAKNGIGVWAGGMLETGLGRAFNIALASKPNFIYSADMSPQQLYYSDDITEPSLKLKPNGCIDVPDEPGLGVTVRQDKIEKYAVNTIKL